MNTFLETLQQRLAEAQRRLGDTEKALESAQLAHQSAARDCDSWRRACEAESKRAGVSVVVSQNSPPEDDADAGEAADANKTQLIRETLRQSQTGMTPADLWHKVKDQVPNRSYVYAVLGRLKKRDHVSVRGGRYRMKIPPKETQEAEARLVQ